MPRVSSGDTPGAWPNPGSPSEPAIPPHPVVPAQPGAPAPEVVYLAQPYAVYPVAASQPYSATPYSATPYSATPYSGMPYSATPQSAPAHPGAPRHPGDQPVSAFAYGPYQANPWTPALLPNPRRAGSAGRWIAAVLTAVLVLGVVGIGAVVGVADYAGALDTRAEWRQANERPAALPPPQSAPASEWTSWVRRSIGTILDAQSEALLAGDQAGYLAPADPTDTKLADELKRRFKVLHAMGLGKWTQRVSGAVSKQGDRSWQAGVEISYCFGTSACEAVELVESATWELDSDHLIMVDLKQSTAQQAGPRPWETDELTVLVGERVIMAATKGQAWRLTEAVAATDRAAKVADTFSRWAAPPDKYLIFLAGPDDWQRWYGHGQPEWAAAWTVPVGGNVSEVVVRTEVVQQRGMQTLLTHELTHVTTLAGKGGGANSAANWWLIEGIADYATMLGKAVNTYDSMAPTRSFVRNGWNGDPSVKPPTINASLADASGRYGVAFLAVRRISDKYGQDRMMDFWGRVVHDSVDLDTAANAVLGAPWATISADCATFIRSVVG